MVLALRPDLYLCLLWFSKSVYYVYYAYLHDIERMGCGGGQGTRRNCRYCVQEDSVQRDQMRYTRSYEYIYEYVEN